MSTSKKNNKSSSCGASYPEMLSAAAVVTIGLTQGRTNEELETLLNFVNLLECNIRSVLTQRLIDDKITETLELNLSE